MGLINARRMRLHGGRAADDGRGVRRHRRQPVRRRSRSSAWRLRAPDAVGHGHHDGLRPVPTNEVATVAGMAGTCGNAGVLIFSLLIGGLVTTHRLHAVLRRPRRARYPRRHRPLDAGARAAADTVTPRYSRHVERDPQSDPARLQPRSVDRARRRRLLHRHLHLRVVSRACRSITRAIWCTGGCSRGRCSRASQLNMRGDPGLLRRLGAVPDPRRRALLSDLYRRQALRPHHGRRRVGRLAARLPQLSRHQPDASTATGPTRSI